MKKFIYRFERLLQIARHKFEESRKKMSILENEKIMLKNKESEFNRELIQTFEKISILQQEKPIQFGMINLLRQGIGVLHQSIRQQIKLIDNKQTEIEDYRPIMLKKYRRVKILEKLRENDQTQHRTIQLKEQDKILDEIGQVGYTLNRKKK